MNDRALFRIPGLLWLLLALLLGGCSEQVGEAPLKGASIGGPFTLIDQDGREVSDTDFAGEYRLVYFGFTYCPDVCPVDLQTMGQGLRAFEKSDPAAAARVQPIFISVDPERDRPEVLKQYVGAFHPRLIGLTGTPEQIAEVAKNHGIYFSRQAGADSEHYLVDHSRMVLLFGPDGEPIAIIPHDQGAEAFAVELDRWVR